MTGYWRNPEATADAFSDGWLRTGDIGHQDADGFYYVDDRKKDVVISGGENIYPAELEAILADCPDIAEAAVIGRPDPTWGEVPVACVVPQPRRRADPRRRPRPLPRSPRPLQAPPRRRLPRRACPAPRWARWKSSPSAASSPHSVLTFIPVSREPGVA